MSDVQVSIRFRNDLLQRLTRGCPLPMYKLAKKLKVSYAWLMGVKSMLRTPYGRRRIGEEPEFSENALRLSAYFQVPPEVLFPEEIYSIKWPSLLEKSFPVERVRALVESEDQRRRALPCHELLETEERDNIIREVLSTRLSKREIRVMELRYGFDGDGPRTREEVSQEVGVTGERVRQIEMKALRSMRKDKRLREFEEETR